MNWISADACDSSTRNVKAGRSEADNSDYRESSRPARYTHDPISKKPRITKLDVVARAYEPMGGWTRGNLNSRPVYKAAGRSGLESKAKVETGFRTLQKHNSTNEFKLRRTVLILQNPSSTKAEDSEQTEPAIVKGPTGVVLRTAWPRTLEASNCLNLPRSPFQFQRARPPFPDKRLSHETWLISKMTSATWSPPVPKTKMTKTSFLSFGSLIIKSSDYPRSCSSFLMPNCSETAPKGWNYRCTLLYLGADTDFEW